MNGDIKSFNREILSKISQIFSQTKGHYLSENEFFKAINVTQINSDNKTYAVPVITKKKTTLPRHSQIDKHLSEYICKQLEIPKF